MDYHKGNTKHYCTELLKRPSDWLYNAGMFLGKTPSILMGDPKQKTSKNLEQRKCCTIEKINRHLGLASFLSVTGNLITMIH